MTHHRTSFMLLCIPLVLLALFRHLPAAHALSNSSCPGNVMINNTANVTCSGNGYCINGTCHCYTHYGGPACANRTHTQLCPTGTYGNITNVTCSGHGYCVNGTCHCYSGYDGPSCSTPTNNSTPYNSTCPGIKVLSNTTNVTCSGNGYCVNGECHCFMGFDGPACANRTYLECPTTSTNTSCSGHGYCNYTSGTCECYLGYSGTDCNASTTPLDCPRNSSGVECSGRGVCDRSRGVCSCTPVPVKNVFGANVTLIYGGPACSIPLNYTCPRFSSTSPQCSGNGDCQPLSGTCNCMKNFFNSSCQYTTVAGGRCTPATCNYRGHCNVYTGRCLCYSNFTGSNCELSQRNQSSNTTSCPKALGFVCAGVGSCNTTTGKCSCPHGFYNASCNATTQSYGVCTPTSCSGNGRCNIATGYCQCDAGYQGTTCAELKPTETVPSFTSSVISTLTSFFQSSDAPTDTMFTGTYPTTATSEEPHSTTGDPSTNPTTATTEEPHSTTDPSTYPPTSDTTAHTYTSDEPSTHPPTSDAVTTVVVHSDTTQPVETDTPAPITDAPATETILVCKNVTIVRNPAPLPPPRPEPLCTTVEDSKFSSVAIRIVTQVMGIYLPFVLDIAFGRQRVSAAVIMFLGVYYGMYCQTSVKITILFVMAFQLIFFTVETIHAAKIPRWIERLLNLWVCISSITIGALTLSISYTNRDIDEVFSAPLSGHQPANGPIWDISSTGIVSGVLCVYCSLWIPPAAVFVDKIFIILAVLGASGGLGLATVSTIVNSSMGILFSIGLVEIVVVFLLMIVLRNNIHLPIFDGRRNARKPLPKQSKSFGIAVGDNEEPLMVGTDRSCKKEKEEDYSRYGNKNSKKVTWAGNIQDGDEEHPENEDYDENGEYTVSGYYANDDGELYGGYYNSGEFDDVSGGHRTEFEDDDVNRVSCSVRRPTAWAFVQSLVVSTFGSKEEEMVDAKPDGSQEPYAPLWPVHAHCTVECCGKLLHTAGSVEQHLRNKHASAAEMLFNGARDPSVKKDTFAWCSECMQMLDWNPDAIQNVLRTLPQKLEYFRQEHRETCPAAKIAEAAAKLGKGKGPRPKIVVGTRDHWLQKFSLEGATRIICLADGSSPTDTQQHTIDEELARELESSTSDVSSETPSLLKQHANLEVVWPGQEGGSAEPYATAVLFLQSHMATHGYAPPLHIFTTTPPSAQSTKSSSAPGHSSSNSVATSGSTVPPQHHRHVAPATKAKADPTPASSSVAPRRGKRGNKKVVNNPPQDDMPLPPQRTAQPRRSGASSECDLSHEGSTVTAVSTTESVNSGSQRTRHGSDAHHHHHQHQFSQHYDCAVATSYDYEPCFDDDANCGNDNDQQ